MDIKLESVLQRVQKPARYTGGEYNSVVKRKEDGLIRVAFCFPDTYEIGMSNLGMRILYGVLNEMTNVWCERVFAPWGDMEEQMRAQNIPLYGLESGDGIKDFDIIAFSLGYELSYTNVLNMLSLAGVELRSENRGEAVPVVIAGGTCAYNPEPLSDFVDLFAIGEGEELLPDIIKAYSASRHENPRKSRFMELAAKIPGVYVPSLYNVTYNTDNTINEISPREGAAKPVVKRIVENLDDAYFPVKTIVPSTEIVHDRVVLELFRGCVRGCRFCQAGHVYRPTRERSAQKLVETGIEALADSGYDEITLSSLSTSDYSELIKLSDGLMDWCEARKISLSLPSLRADNFSVDLMSRVQKVRKSGLTFAPEAGSQRLRDVINKNVSEDDLLNTCRVAFEGGWNSVKLYFMLGLPTETDDDVLAISDLSRKVLYTWKQYAKNKSRGVKITVSTSCFIPKAHTPFQWEPMIARDEYLRRVNLLRDSMKTKAINYNWHEAESGYIEAAFSRGDRRLGSVIEAAWRLGARLDSWGEYFSSEIWQKAFELCGIDPEFYVSRTRSPDETLPWSAISPGVTESHLRHEREAAFNEKISPDCRNNCSGCGAEELGGGVYCG